MNKNIMINKFFRSLGGDSLLTINSSSKKE